MAEWNEADKTRWIQLATTSVLGLVVIGACSLFVLCGILLETVFEIGRLLP